MENSASTRLPRPRVTIQIPEYSSHHQAQSPYLQTTAATSGISGARTTSPSWPPIANQFINNDSYNKQAGDFVFKQYEGFKDFTLSTAKSGLSVGERSVFVLYEKFSTWSKKWFTHLFLFAILFLYSVGGASLFMAVEGTHEKQILTNIRREKHILAGKIMELALDKELLQDAQQWEGALQNQLNKYDILLREAFDEGYYTANRNETWSFINAMFYCGTIYTTIGYGHIAPSTSTGRAITIIYAIFGIPIFLILLADFGKLFTRAIKFFWAYVRRVYYTGSCRKVRKTAQAQEMMRGLNVMYDFVRKPSLAFDPHVEAQHPAQLEQIPQSPMSYLSVPTTCDSPTTPVPENYEINDDFNLPVSVAFCILIAYLIFGASIFYVWEEWSFFDSFYFVFISISTIGLGDFVPQHPLVLMISIVYLMFGLALTSMCINVIQLKLSDSFRQASKKIGTTIGLLQMAEAASQNSHQSTPQSPSESSQPISVDTKNASLTGNLIKTTNNVNGTPNLKAK